MNSSYINIRNEETLKQYGILWNLLCNKQLEKNYFSAKISAIIFLIISILIFIFSVDKNDAILPIVCLFIAWYIVFYLYYGKYYFKKKKYLSAIKKYIVEKEKNNKSTQFLLELTGDGIKYSGNEYSTTLKWNYFVSYYYKDDMLFLIPQKNKNSILLSKSEFEYPTFFEDIAHAAQQNIHNQLHLD